MNLKDIFLSFLFMLGVFLFTAFLIWFVYARFQGKTDWSETGLENIQKMELKGVERDFLIK